MNILDELYYGNYSAQPRSNSEYKAAMEAVGPYWDKIKELTSREFTDQFWLLQMEVTNLECLNYFRNGFRLGFQLALEGSADS